MESDSAYFKRRSIVEHLAALKADHPEARRAHSAMAERYEDLARAIEGQERRLDGPAKHRTGIWI